MADTFSGSHGSVSFARRASGLIADRDLDQAIAVLREGTRLNPSYATGFLLLGETLARTGDDDGSRDMLERALALDPQHPRLLFMLGRAWLEADPDRARELLWKARRYEPDHHALAEAFHVAIASIDSAGSPADTESVPEDGDIDWMGTSEPDALPETDSVDLDPDDTISEPESLAFSPVEPSADTEEEPDWPGDLASEGTGMHLDNAAIDELLSVVPEIDSPDGKPRFIISEPPIDQDAALPDDGRLASAEDRLSSETESPFALHVFDSAATGEPPLGTGQQDLDNSSAFTETDSGATESAEDDTPLFDLGEFSGGYADLLEQAFSGETAAEPDAAIDLDEDSPEPFDAANPDGEVILTERERAELAALDSGPEPEPDGDAPELASDHGFLFESSGILSPEELESLSSISKAPADGEELDTAMHSGIDYADVLYDHVSLEDENQPGESARDRAALDEFEAMLLKEHGPLDPQPDPDGAVPDSIEPEPVGAVFMPVSAPDDAPAGYQVPPFEESLNTAEFSDFMDASLPGEAMAEIMAGGAIVSSEHTRMLEQVIRNSMAPEDLDSIDRSPLDALIDAYQAALGSCSEYQPDNAVRLDIPRESSALAAPAVAGGDAGRETVRRVAADRMHASSDDELSAGPPDTSASDSSDFPIGQGDSTATMAEIFLKQGMISRAVAIYQGLVRKQPDNQTLSARLREIQLRQSPAGQQ